MRAPIRSSRPPPPSCAARLRGRAGRRHRHGSKSFRVGDVEFRARAVHRSRSISVRRRRCRRDAMVAPPWSTLPWHRPGPDGGGRDARLGRVLAGRGEAARRPWLDLVRSDEMNEAACRCWSQPSSVTDYRPDRLAVAGQRGGCAQAVGRARGVLQGARALPGDQRSVPAQALVAATASRSRRFAISPIRWAWARTTPTPFRAAASSPRSSATVIGSGLFGDIELIAEAQRSYDIVRKPLQSIARRPAQALGARMPLSS